MSKLSSGPLQTVSAEQTQPLRAGGDLQVPRPHAGHGGALPDTGQLPKETVARGIKSLVPDTGQLQAGSKWTVSGSLESLVFFLFFQPFLISQEFFRI